MRVLVIVTSLFIAMLNVATQEVPPNAAPSPANKGRSRVGQLDIEQKTDKSKQVNPTQSPIATCTESVPCFVVTEPKVKSKEEQAKADSLDLLYRRYMWATIFGVLGAFVGIVILISQTVLVRRSANAAIIAANVARDTLYLTQAADVHIEGVNLLPKPLGSGTHIDVAVKNHGQTRAEKFSNDLILGIKGRPTGPIQQRSDIAVVIGAGQTYRLGFGALGQTLTTEVLAQVLAGQFKLQIWGTLRYMDIFGKGYIIDCEATYNIQEGNFFVDRYEHRHENDAPAN
jgi:hypothetical protein